MQGSMSSRPDPIERVRELAKRLESFEASGSVPDTATGTRREGQAFEMLMAELWRAFSDRAKRDGAVVSSVEGFRGRPYAQLVFEDRYLLIPDSSNHAAGLGTTRDFQPAWLDLEFKVDALVERYPGRAEAVLRYAPRSGAFAAGKYPEMYENLTTKFDDTVVLVDRGVLREKILLEYKTAKSTKGKQLDGNAHERLSFQVLQYLEVATRYTKCSMAVMSNGAFIKYRNKYHVNFHVQADRLSNFAWFSLELGYAADDYLNFLQGLLDWLLTGQTRTPLGRTS
jgi:hypothetical protein